MIITGCCASVVQQLASYVSDIGYSYEVSAMVSSCSLGLMAVGKLLTGRMYDKLGVRHQHPDLHGLCSSAVSAS